jgi:hypothetical protein
MLLYSTKYSYIYFYRLLAGEGADDCEAVAGEDW